MAAPKHVVPPLCLINFQYETIIPQVAFVAFCAFWHRNYVDLLLGSDARVRERSDAVHTPLVVLC